MGPPGLRVAIYDSTFVTKTCTRATILTMATGRTSTVHRREEGCCSPRS